MKKTCRWHVFSEEACGGAPHRGESARGRMAMPFGHPSGRAMKGRQNRCRPVFSGFMRVCGLFESEFSSALHRRCPIPKSVLLPAQRGFRLRFQAGGPAFSFSRLFTRQKARRKFRLFFRYNHKGGLAQLISHCAPAAHPPSQIMSNIRAPVFPFEPP